MKGKLISIRGTRAGCEIKVGDVVWDNRKQKWGTVIKRGDEDFSWKNADPLAFDPFVPTLAYRDGTTDRMNTTWLWKDYYARRTWKNLWGIFLKRDYGHGRTYFFNNPEIINL